MKKAVVFGTFDIFHPGHEYFLKQAKKHCDELVVVIARDSTVKQVKGKLPVNNENKRLKLIKSLHYVNKAMLGSESEDKYCVIEQVMPDIICLGYDQKAFVENLQEELKKRGLKAGILRIDSYKPELYKSSKSSASKR
jgi:FAD synthetase